MLFNKIFVKCILVMNYDNLINLTSDPILPDLVPEEPIYDEIFKIDDLLMPIPHPDIAELSRKIDLLTVEANTQGLRLEVEKVKRQRLQATVRQLKRDLSLPHPDIAMLKSEIAQLRDYQNSVNFQLDVRTNTLSFRSLSRICQILIALVPSSTMPSQLNPEIEILLQELDNTIRHFGVHYLASNI